MNEREIISILPGHIEKISKETGAFEIIDRKTGFGGGKPKGRKASISPDLVLKIKTKTKRGYTFYVDVKSTGQPRYVRSAVNQLQEMTANEPGAYGILATKYLSKESTTICKENGIGFIDLAGNCLINIDDIYIDIQGKPNPNPEKRRLKSLFSYKATRALRVLLSDPAKDWYVKELAEKANISLGLASNLKQKLLDFEFIKDKGKKAFCVSAPEALLVRWSENYNYRENKTAHFYSLDEMSDIENKLVEYCDSQRIQYGFTLSSGASRTAPSLRYNQVFAYISVPADQVARELGWKEVTSGANILLLEPYDEGIFYGLQAVDGYKIVSDVQLYLDLKSYKGRGEEAAEFLLENRLRKKW